jgi:hypothetical protein
VDFSKLKISDWLVGGGAIAYLIAMFLPWYQVKNFSAANVKGWDYFFFGIIPLLLIIAVFLALVLPKLMDGKQIIPDPIGPLPRLQAALIAAGVAAAIVLLRLLIKDDGDVPGAADFIERGIGLFLAFIAAAVVAAGAFMKYSGKDPDTAAPGSGPATPF